MSATATLSRETAQQELTPIFEETFQSLGIPADWYTDTAVPSYGNGVWDCRKGDGVVIPFGREDWKVLRVEVDLSDLGPNATAFVGTDARTALQLSLGTNPNARHGATDGGLVITQSKTLIPRAYDTAKLVFEWTADSMRATINGTEVLNVPNFRESAHAGSLQTGFRDCLVRRYSAAGEAAGEAESEAPPAPIQAIDKSYPLEVTVDFNDDLMPCAWSHQTFDNAFRELKSWGTKRVSWIDLGRAADDYFAYAPLGIATHARQTIENVGDIFTAAVQHAHKEGMELYGIFKPYDMAIMGITHPPFSEQAKTQGRIHRIGGSLGWSTKMAEENQHLITARRPKDHGPAINEVWTRLDLVKDDDATAAISVDDIQFIISDDNDNFRAYDGPLTRTEAVEDYPVYRTTPSGPRPSAETRRCRVFRFEFQISEPFMAIVVNGTTRSFSNRLRDLVHVFGPAGEETRLTYGLAPRAADHVSIFEIPANGENKAVGPQGGFEYNRYPGSPSGMSGSGGEPMNVPLSLDRGKTAYIALARGKDRGPGAVMSPCFPETRALWMGWVEAMLDAGADGIDLRPGHHHADFAWSEYGFEQPVRDEMLRLTGVDIWETDDFDQELWRRVRGEGWTQFVREASALTRSRGKKFVAHVDAHYDNASHLPGPMNIVKDWKIWLHEGLLDGITGKALWPESSFAREVLQLAHSKGVPVSYGPYCNNFFEDRSTMNHVGGSPKGCEIPVERLIHWGRKAGFDSFLFYECASALRAAEDGTVDFRPNATPLRQVMQRNFHL